ncbi:MAG: class I SAM-dependent methyltransferase [Bacteroidia bacterium]|nr:class I SAM-dependent methyltransferase [Bacteroidia bacterium]
MEYFLRKLKNYFFPGPIDLSDEYINRLFCANAGMLIRGNLLAFDYAIRHLPSDSPLVETGSYAGLSANVITYFLQKYQRNNVLFTCDNWSYCGEKDHLNPGEPYMTRVGDHPYLTRTDYMQFVRDSFLRNVSFFSSRRLPHSFDLTSVRFWENWEDGTETKDMFGRMTRLGGAVSFGFIDGDHHPEAAWEDWKNLDRHLEPGGFVLLDDSADHSQGGRKILARELLRHKGYIFVLKNPNYLFRKC